MWYGAALLGLWVAYVTARGELPIYLGFLIPQGSAAAPPAQSPSSYGTPSGAPAYIGTPGIAPQAQPGVTEVQPVAPGSGAPIPTFGYP